MKWIFAIMSFLALQSPAEKYKNRNPVVVTHATEAEARDAAMASAKQSGGGFYRTSGTGSMEPLMVGQVFIVNTKKPYDKLMEGDIANYRPAFKADGTMFLHRLVQKDRDGWIASGDNNKRSESWARVKPDNYVDVVTAIHTWKGAEKTRVKK